MIQTGIVVFREALEVAIIAALLLTATRGVRGRSAWFAVGLAAGIAGAGVVAVFAEGITDSFAGRGQDLFNAAVLLATVAMVAWTIAWMRSHARTLARDALATGERIRTGHAPLYLLASTVAVSVLRDGSELVVFLTALRLSGELPPNGIAGGFAIGLLGGAIVGALIYYGVVRTAIRGVFAVVTALLAFIGAGLAAQAAGFLVSGGWLPPFIDPVWDTSGLLDDGAPTGQIAHVLFGYISQPNALQVLAYFTVLALIGRLGLQAQARA
jgi:high-affinity iron transporter